VKLGTLKNSQRRDGDLVVVSRDNVKAVKATGIAPNLREAVENWEEARPKLEQLSRELESDQRTDAFEVIEEDFHSPMPRSFQWAHGSQGAPSRNFV
jgi:fumarylacetoacetate (FAA) hydrolase